MRYGIKLFLTTGMIGLFFLISFPVNAEEHLFDQAHLFSDTKETEILDKLAEFRKNTDMEAVVVTTNNAEGKSARQYADDFYNNGGYGVGSDFSGFLFLIDMENRDYWISTKGKMKQLLTDGRIEKMLGNAENDMASGNYGAAALSIINDAISYNQRYTYDSQTGSFKKVKSFTPLKTVIALVIGLIAGIISYSSVLGSYNLKRSTYKYAYREKGTLQLRQKEDHLIDTFTTSRHIPKPTNTSGGGGFGNGSSGGGNGGGGRSF